MVLSHIFIPSLSSYSIHGHDLDLVDAAKYLGVYIDSKISFNTHVDAVAKKANSTRAFLSRNLSHCSRKIKETSYKTFVRPIAEYAASAWDPHTQRNIKKIEQIQRSSARFVTGNYDRTCSVTAMVQELQWSTLAARRCMSRLVMMYHIWYDLIDINWASISSLQHLGREAMRHVSCVHSAVHPSTPTLSSPHHP